MADYTEDLDGFAAVQYASARYARAVGKEVGEDARRMCPVDTGRLQSTINVEAVGDTVYCEVGTPYWSFQEYGTSKMAAQPFMRPALRKRRNVQYMIDDPTL